MNWKIAALGVLAIVLTLAVTPMTWQQLAVNLTAVALLASAQRWPIASGIIMIGLFIFISAAEEVRSLTMILSAPFLVSLVAMVGRPRAAAAFAIAIGYISATSPFTGRWVPNDFTGVAIFFVALAGAGGAESIFADYAYSTPRTNSVSVTTWRSAANASPKRSTTRWRRL